MSDIEKQKNKELEEDVNKVVDMTMHNLKLIVNDDYYNLIAGTAEYYSEVYVSIQGLEEEERERVKTEYKDLFESKIIVGSRNVFNVITP